MTKIRNWFVSPKCKKVELFRESSFVVNSTTAADRDTALLGPHHKRGGGGRNNKKKNFSHFSPKQMLQNFKMPGIGYIKRCFHRRGSRTISHFFRLGQLCKVYFDIFVISFEFKFLTCTKSLHKENNNFLQFNADSENV